MGLRDRALLADTAGAALAAADGAVDWWCRLAIDADPTFAGILDPRAGSVRVGPAGVRAAGSQTYDERTFVLRTVLPGPEAELEIVDLLPWDGSAPPGRLVRVVTARRGPVDVEVDVVPASAFRPATRVSSFSSGLAFDGLVVRAGMPLAPGGVARLDAGDRLVVTVDARDPHRPLRPDEALDLAGRTAVAWRRELNELAYEGPHRSLVERCVLTLVALGTADAATTSLPEHEGGERNVDGRVASLRHVATSVDLLERVGMREQSARRAQWLSAVLDAAAVPPPGVLALDGSRPADEREVTGLTGWRSSQPVRVGVPVDRPRLDHLGPLALVAPRLHAGGRLRELAAWLAEGGWATPDAGTWGVRSRIRRFPSSALSAWIALHELAAQARAENPLDLDALVWSEAAEELEHWLGTHLDDAPLDASLLRLAWRSPWGAGDRRVVRTAERTLAELSTGPFVARLGPTFDDGFPPTGSCSIEASAWAVRALAALGRWDEAHERMDELVGFVGPLGLAPEAAEPLSGAFLGNLPSAGAAIALVEAALALAAGPR